MSAPTRPLDLPTPFNRPEEASRFVAWAESTAELDALAEHWSGDREVLLYHLAGRLSDLSEALFRSVVREADHMTLDRLVYVAPNLSDEQSQVRLEVLIERLAAAPDVLDGRVLQGYVSELAGTPDNAKVAEATLALLERTRPRTEADLPDRDDAESVLVTFIERLQEVPIEVYRRALDTVAMNETVALTLLQWKRLDREFLLELRQRFPTSWVKARVGEVVRDDRALRMSQSFRDEVRAWVDAQRVVPVQLLAFDAVRGDISRVLQALRSLAHGSDAPHLADMLELMTPEQTAALTEADWATLMSHDDHEVRSAALRAIGRHAAWVEAQPREAKPAQNPGTQPSQRPGRPPRR